MSWSNINNDSFFLASSNILEDLNKLEMVRTHFVSGVYVINEVKKALLTQTLGHLRIVLF